VSPPFQTPDEFNHFYRAYQVSQGRFFAEKSDKRVGGHIPVALEDFTMPYKTMSFITDHKMQAEYLEHAFRIKLTSATVFKDFPNTAVYSPVSYLPQATTLYVLSRFNCSVGTLYYGGKLVVFLVWLFSMLFVIRILPFHKWLFTALLLLPMQLYITNSLSADTVTNILAYLLVALILKFSFSERRVAWKQLLLILCVGLLLVITKVIYASILLLMIIIPARQFKNNRYKVISLAVIFFAVMALALIWTRMTMGYYIAYSDYNQDFAHIATLQPAANFSAQKIFLQEYPLHFLHVVFNSFIQHAEFYLVSYIGHFGTYMGTPLPLWAVISSLAVLFFLSIFEKSGVRMLWWQKGAILLTVFILFSAVAMSQYIIWTKVGADNVESIQGRYLIPFFPVFFLLFSNRLKKKPGVALITMVFIFLINFFALQLLYQRYIHEKYQNSNSFACSFEETTENGFFITSKPSVWLQGTEALSATESRSGKYSVALDSATNVYAIYTFADFRPGDFLQIDVWKKGKGGEIVINGCGKNCEDYLFASNAVFFEDDNGWERMNMTFLMPNVCDSSRATFYLRNDKPTPVYFDDLKIISKTQKTK
jgi:uncharacterized membrane protein